MIKPLTSLRFFFALMVFGSHLHYRPDSKAPFLALIHEFLAQGSLGVSFFFVLSGFILTHTYEDRLLQKKTSKRKFWVARFARIYPLHLLTMLLAIPLSLNAPGFHFIDWLIIIVANLSLTQSFLPFGAYFFSLNKVSWSISDEAFFYLIFPMLIVLLAKHKKVSIALFAAAALSFVFTLPLVPAQYIDWFGYINPLTRVLDFALGILLYQVYKHSKQDIGTGKANVMELGAIALFVLLLCFHGYVDPRYRYSLYYWPAMAAIILAFSFQKGYVSKLMSAPSLIALGEISFAFYMIHQLALRTFEHFAPAYAFNSLVTVCIVLPLSLGLSFILHHFVEMPMNKWIKQIAEKKPGHLPAVAAVGAQPLAEPRDS